ncbi:MAG: antitoxin [Rhodococcus sp.]|nr:antitoxin [Rhodococcus sp. (in: high G+C Gram-positive bacteria)]
MSTQIAVRLPDEIVDFIDEEVGHDRARSRAAVVLRALERERRRLLAERDAAILATTASESDDMDALAKHVSTLPSDLD